MTTSKHTPGPWAYSKIGNNYDQYMVYSETENPGVNIINTVEGKANAVLIASAPELLDALKGLAKDINASLLKKQIQEVVAQDMTMTIVRAITKATL